MGDAEKQCAPQAENAHTQWPGKHVPSYAESLRDISAVLNRARRCFRCGAGYTELESIGRTQCTHHPVAHLDKCVCTRARGTVAANAVIAFRRFEPPLKSRGNLRGKEDQLTGCSSIDHAHNGHDSRQVYALMPLCVWHDLFESRPDAARLLQCTQRFHAYSGKGGGGGGDGLHAEMNIVRVLTASQAYADELCLHFLGDTEPPRSYTLHELYDECAAMFHYAPLENVSHSDVQRYLDERHKEAVPPRPLGDAHSAHATKQRKIFDLANLDDELLETPDFVPFVVIVRVELERVEYIKK